MSSYGQLDARSSQRRTLPDRVGLAFFAWVLFAGSLAEAVMVGVLGFVFCWYGVGMLRTGSWSLT